MFISCCSLTKWPPSKRIATATKRIVKFEIKCKIHGEELKYLQICSFKIFPISYLSQNSCQYLKHSLLTVSHY